MLLMECGLVAKRVLNFCFLFIFCDHFAHFMHCFVNSLHTTVVDYLNNENVELHWYVAINVILDFNKQQFNL